MDTSSSSVRNWGSILLKILWGTYRMDLRIVPLKDRELIPLGIFSADSQPLVDESSLWESSISGLSYQQA